MTQPTQSTAPDLAGRVALVTVANKGLGHAIGRSLAALGGIVYIGARNAERGGRAAAQLGHGSCRSMHGASEPEQIAPEPYVLDTLLMQHPGNKDIQADLSLNYANNLKLHPEFQAFLREHKPPTLVIWGKHDPFFIRRGAEVFMHDNPQAAVELLDTGHFALETHVDQIAERIVDALGDAIV